MVSLLVALAARRPTDIPSLFLSLPAPLFSVQAALLPLRGALCRDPPGRPRRRPRHRRQHLHRQPLRRRVVPVQLVRCVEITADGGLRFWIGNIELDIPYDKITGLHRLEPVDDTVFRGVKLDLAAKYGVDDEIVWWAFSSATATAAPALKAGPRPPVGVNPI